MRERAETRSTPGDALGEYRRKREPSATPEPFGATAAGHDAASGVFVVQQHAARRMHWDLRLEVRGTLASWAVPRGPSLDPKERRLAVRTEDHPMEYADFEAIIPPGNYGAGAMIVWDRGRFETVDGGAAGKAVEAGKFDVLLSGAKLQGRFTLVQTKQEGGKNWLLLCKYSGRQVADIAVAEPASVLSGLTVEELAAGVDRAPALQQLATTLGATALRKGRVAPMQAESSDTAFNDPQWAFEIKWDGARILARRDGDKVQLQYRSGRDATEAFPEVVRAVRRLPCRRFTLDGEVVVLDGAGISRFELLQPRFMITDRRTAERAAGARPAVMFAFDLLDIEGLDLTPLPLLARARILRQMLPPRGAVIRQSEMFGSDGAALLAAVAQHGGEGVVAKRLESTYQIGRRSRDWLKIKLRQTADLTIIGYLPSDKQRNGLASVLLAWWRDGRLVYAGNAGSGLNADGRAELRRELDTRRRPQPVCELPARGLAGAIYCEPTLVAEASYHEITSAGLLRAPVFERLRPDKTPNECLAPAVRTEEPKAVPPSQSARDESAALAPSPQALKPSSPQAHEPSRTVFTNVDKVFWPDLGYTKGDLIEYYREVWPWLAPYLRDRPLVLTRYPDGIAGKNFFQKNAPAFTPPWVQTENIDGTDYFLCNDLDSLLYVANSACIPIHVWNARVGSLDRPDWCILDLDPKKAPFEWVVRIAQVIHHLLEELGLPGQVKTSGQSGLHVMVPLGGQLSQPETKMFGELLAHAVVVECGEIATTARAIENRGDKVYVDFLQNGFGKTIVAPLSLRPVPAATVSAPLAWSEVRRGLDLKRYDIRTMGRRLRRRGDDMRQLLEAQADIGAALQRLEAYMAGR